MKGLLSFYPLEEDDDLSRANVFKGDIYHDYEVRINTLLDDDFYDIISNPYDLEENIDIDIDSRLYDEEWKDFLTKFKNNRLQYIKSINDITFGYFDYKKIADFVKKNPVLSTKRLIFNVPFDLSLEKMDEINELFDYNTSNLYFSLYDNDSLITFKEYKDTISAIDKMINEVEKFNFSPLEKIMYIYDIVRDKVYTEVDDGEDKRNSRDLTSSLLSDKIVCLGYARIFTTLIKRLGIKCNTVFLINSNNNKNGHARNVIFVDDEKYGVKGVYYFDPTYDNKKSESDNNFLYSYRWFAVTKAKMDKIGGRNLFELKFPYYSKDMVQEFEKLVGEVGLNGLPKEFIDSINYMAGLTGSNSLLFRIALINSKKTFELDNEEFNQKLAQIVKYFNSPIAPDVLLKVLYNVRKQQYYVNPDKYPFGVDDLCKIAYESCWYRKMTTEEKLLLKIFDEKEHLECDPKSVVGKFEKDIEQVRLARTLKRVYEQKNK